MGVRVSEAKSPKRFAGNIRRLRSLGRRRSSSSILSTPPQSNESVRTVEFSLSLCQERLLLTEDSETTTEDYSSEGGVTTETEGGDSAVLQSERIRDPIKAWLHDGSALMRSDEMISFVVSSRDLMFEATGFAVRVACLPVTVPLHVVGGTTSLVIRTCTDVTFGIAEHVFPSNQSGEDTGSSPPWAGLARSAAQIVPFVCHTAERVKNDVGTTILHLVAPFVDQQQAGNDSGSDRSPQRYVSCAGESSAENESFLERLRLDYPGEETEMVECSKKVKVPGRAIRSRFLLRVGDLGVHTKVKDKSTERRVYFVDLMKDHAEEYLTGQALDALVTQGLALFSGCEECRVGKAHKTSPVQWKPEGATEKLIRKKHKISPQQWISRLKREVLIWSGRFEGGKRYGKKFPLFLAGGLICMSPRAILRMMWDSRRTGEYNKWSVGRRDLMVMEDGNVLASDDIPATRATKIVESETKVPFTGFVVTLSTLMHVRPLEQEGEKGFVIVSRSLNAGRAGCHFRADADVHDSSGNEIMWGVNVLRSVPGQVNMTNFTSVSQVGSSLVPGFLSKKIGTMGVEDFFSALRALEK